MFDQSLLRQQPQRLPKRRPADPQISAQLLLDNLFTRAEAAAEDGVAQAVARDVDERRGQVVPRSVNLGSRHATPW